MKRIELLEQNSKSVSVLVNHETLQLRELKEGLSRLLRIEDLFYFWKNQKPFVITFRKAYHTKTFDFDLWFSKAEACFQFVNFPKDVDKWKIEEAEKLFLEHLEDAIISYQDRIDYLNEEVEI